MKKQSKYTATQDKSGRKGTSREDESQNSSDEDIRKQKKQKTRDDKYMGKHAIAKYIEGKKMDIHVLAGENPCERLIDIMKSINVEQLPELPPPISVDRYIESIGLDALSAVEQYEQTDGISAVEFRSVLKKLNDAIFVPDPDAAGKIDLKRSSRGVQTGMFYVPDADGRSIQSLHKKFHRAAERMFAFPGHTQHESLYKAAKKQSGIPASGIDDEFNRYATKIRASIKADGIQRAQERKMVSSVYNILENNRIMLGVLAEIFLHGSIMTQCKSFLKQSKKELGHPQLSRQTIFLIALAMTRKFYRMKTCDGTTHITVAIRVELLTAILLKLGLNPTGINGRRESNFQLRADEDHNARIQTRIDIALFKNQEGAIVIGLTTVPVHITKDDVDVPEDIQRACDAIAKVDFMPEVPDIQDVPLKITDGTSDDSDAVSGGECGQVGDASEDDDQSDSIQDTRQTFVPTLNRLVVNPSGSMRKPPGPGAQIPRQTADMRPAKMFDVSPQYTKSQDDERAYEAYMESAKELLHDLTSESASRYSSTLLQKLLDKAREASAYLRDQLNGPPDIAKNYRTNMAIDKLDEAFTIAARLIASKCPTYTVESSNEWRYQQRDSGAPPSVNTPSIQQNAYGPLGVYARDRGAPPSVNTPSIQQNAYGPLSVYARDSGAPPSVNTPSIQQNAYGPLSMYASSDTARVAPLFSAGGNPGYIPPVYPPPAADTYSWSGHQNDPFLQDLADISGTSLHPFQGAPGDGQAGVNAVTLDLTQQATRYVHPPPVPTPDPPPVPTSVQPSVPPLVQSSDPLPMPASDPLPMPASDPLPMPVSDPSALVNQLDDTDVAAAETIMLMGKKQATAGPSTEGNQTSAGPTEPPKGRATGSKADKKPIVPYGAQNAASAILDELAHKADNGMLSGLQIQTPAWVPTQYATSYNNFFIGCVRNSIETIPRATDEESGDHVRMEDREMYSDNFKSAWMVFFQQKYALHAGIAAAEPHLAYGKILSGPFAKYAGKPLVFFEAHFTNYMDGRSSIPVMKRFKQSLPRV